MQHTNKKIRKFLKLEWSSTPSKAMPHGLWGIISVVTGLYLIAHSITGNLEPYERSSNSSSSMPPYVLALYSISSLFNAIAGYRLTHKAWAEMRSVFKQCALLQISLVYFVIRFSCLFSTEASAWSRHGGLGAIRIGIRLLDGAFALSTFLCILAFQKTALDQWTNSTNTNNTKCISVAVSIGSMALLLLSIYPLQLALFGQEWWVCIQNRYPAQSTSMVAFIYVPTTVTFSLILFGATLYQRGILSNVQFGAGSGVIVMVCVVGTVLTQELHVLNVSTQRIYLPCHEPDFGSMEGDLVKALDFSRYARRILTAALNVEFENDLYENE